MFLAASCFSGSRSAAGYDGSNGSRKFRGAPPSGRLPTPRLTVYGVVRSRYIGSCDQLPIVFRPQLRSRCCATSPERASHSGPNLRNRLAHAKWNDVGEVPAYDPFVALAGATKGAYAESSTGRSLK